MLSTRKSMLALTLGLVVSAMPAQAQAPMKLIPADSNLVAYFDVRKSLSSQLVKRFAIPQIENELKKNKKAQQFFTAIKVNPLTDIDSVLLTNAGTKGDQVLVVINGKFDKKWIDAAMGAWAKNQPAKIKIEKVGAAPLYVINEAGMTSYVALLDDKTIVASPFKKYAVSAISGKMGAPSKTLQATLNKATRNQTGWLAGVIPAAVKQELALQPGAALIAENLVAISGSLNLTKELAASLQVHTTNAQSARALEMLAMNLRGVLQIAATDVDAAPVINELLQTLKIQSKQSTVDFRFKLSDGSIQTIEKLIKKAQQ